MSKKLSFTLPTLDRGVYYECNNKDEDGNIVNFNYEKIKKENLFKIKENGIINCYDINDLYNWVIIQGKLELPYTRFKVNDDLKKEIEERYLLLHYNLSKIEFYKQAGKPLQFNRRIYMDDQYFIYNPINKKWMNCSMSIINIMTNINAYTSYPFYIVNEPKENDNYFPPQRIKLNSKILQLLQQYLDNKEHTSKTKKIYKDIKEFLNNQVGGKNMKVKDLQAECRKRNIPFSGLRKGQLINVLNKK